MTIPLWCLFFAAVMPYLIAGTGAYFRSKAPGGLDNKNPRAQAAQLEGAGARAYAAQSNAWEALGVFTAAVVINHLGHGDPGQSATAALVFVGARVLHPIVYIKNIDALRSLTFAVGFGACMWLIGLAINAPVTP